MLVSTSHSLNNNSHFSNFFASKYGDFSKFLRLLKILSFASVIFFSNHNVLAVNPKSVFLSIFSGFLLAFSVLFVIF
jgi:hypothetical protein